MFYIIYKIYSVFGFAVYSVSLRQQLQDVGKKLVGAQHYNKDGAVNNRQEIDSLLHFTSLLFCYFYKCVLSFMFLVPIIIERFLSCSMKIIASILFFKVIL